jgi:hypothetical protein
MSTPFLAIHTRHIMSLHSRMNIHVTGLSRSWRDWAALGAAMMLGAALSAAIRAGGPKSDTSAHDAARGGWDTLAKWGAAATSKAPAPDAATPDDAPAAEGRSPQAVFEHFMTATRQADPVEAVIALVKSDAKFRSELIGRYLDGLPGDENIKTRFVLSESQSNEVVSKALEAARGNDVKKRLRAMDLLVSMQDGQNGARAYLADALAHDTDPQVLAMAASSLRPQPFISPKDSQVVTDRLKALRDNPDERVQKAALSALAMWEGGQAIEKDVLQGMQSSNPNTVVFSIQTALQGQLKSDAFKEALFVVVERADLPVDLRRHVVELLGSIRLSESEYERLLRARGQL